MQDTVVNKTELPSCIHLTKYLLSPLINLYKTWNKHTDIISHIKRNA